MGLSFRSLAMTALCRASTLKDDLDVEEEAVEDGLFAAGALLVVVGMPHKPSPPLRLPPPRPDRADSI